MSTTTTLPPSIQESVHARLDSVQVSQYVMPAEHTRQSHTLMGFPSIASADSEEHLNGLQEEIARIANAIARFQPVHLYTREELVSKARSMVDSNVVVKPATLDQLWVRDSGPVYVQDTLTKTRKRIGFNFNYWGSKLPRTGDEYFAEGLTGEEFVKPRITMEGGGIEHDGEGTFLGTESCVLNDNRNPGMKREEIEAEIKNMLGVTHFIWIPGVKGYDITDYHIDALARFVEPGVVLLSKPAPESEKVVIDVYEEARKILLSSTDAKGRSLKVIDCEEPITSELGPVTKHDERVASYANYLLVNGAVILPKFGQQAYDTRAYDQFKQLFPSREVVQVLINSLPRTGGGIHCATQQVPLI